MSKNKIIKSIFIGKDKSLGFKKGYLYTLKVDCPEDTGFIRIKSVGVNNLGSICIYSNIIKFLDNWNNIENL